MRSSKTTERVADMLTRSLAISNLSGEEHVDYAVNAIGALNECTDEELVCVLIAGSHLLSSAKTRIQLGNSIIALSDYDQSN